MLLVLARAGGWKLVTLKWSDAVYDLLNKSSKGKPAAKAHFREHEWCEIGGGPRGSSDATLEDKIISALEQDAPGAQELAKLLMQKKVLWRHGGEDYVSPPDFLKKIKEVLRGGGGGAAPAPAPGMTPALADKLRARTMLESVTLKPVMNDLLDAVKSGAVEVWRGRAGGKDGGIGSAYYQVRRADATAPPPKGMKKLDPEAGAKIVQRKIGKSAPAPAAPAPASRKPKSRGEQRLAPPNPNTLDGRRQLQRQRERSVRSRGARHPQQGGGKFEFPEEIDHPAPAGRKRSQSQPRSQ